ncbi:MAG: hypothetical protein E7289_01275 [Lachnospiraceae bacterium]|nr:hypothetical protein [Lachnospiraceae bacterium]
MMLGINGYAGAYAYGSSYGITGTGNSLQTGDRFSKNPGESDVKNVGRASSPADCQTCKERKYQDGSDEMVSFKSAAHISPNAAASAVRAHEQEHVSNAFKKAAKGDGQVLQASVRLKTAVCPECGRSYVAGGETATKIKYSNEENPYQKALKKAQESALAGMNFDAAV